MPPTASEVAGAVAAVRRRIAAAAKRAGRDPAAVRLAETGGAGRPRGLGEREGLLEVELTGRPGHPGFAPAALAGAVAAIGVLGGLRLRGLMTMAPPVVGPEQARPVFARLRHLR